MYKNYPEIIQGGMGVGISGSELARAVSINGQLGSISGVMLERVLAYTLQKGDPDGDMRRALSHFPFQKIVKLVFDTFYVKGGITKNNSFKKVPIFTINPSELLISTVICANYALVWLAKENNTNPININYLEKVSMPHVYAITGAMLADVDFITMGAGIPLQIPGLIDAISKGENATYRVPVIGKETTSYLMNFDLRKFFGTEIPKMKKPGFIPIISSNLLASIFMTKLPQGSIYGFVIEEPSAGGHNAPPRKMIFSESGEPQPIYGTKDEVDYSKIAELGLPFWIGGAKASPESLKRAILLGAKGIQVGSIFALCEESGLDFKIRNKIRRLGFNNKLRIRTDMKISPTGFPFKVAVLKNTLSEKSVYQNRTRKCDKAGLVSLYEKPNGQIGYRCAAEPIENYLLKGGDLKDIFGRGCLCNGLFTTCGFGNQGEPPIVTLGDDYSFLSQLMENQNSSYKAIDAIKYLLS